MREPYYLAYEQRYRRVYEAGGERWGHDTEDPVLAQALANWVRDNGLEGKMVIEYACGEGAAGVILSRLGCRYHGVDIAPSAVERAAEALRPFPQAQVSLLDMVKQAPQGAYDAALDCMGYHMLVTDPDRAAYLNNAASALKRGAPMLFFRESYREPEPQAGPVDTYARWLELTGEDYQTLQLRHTIQRDGREAPVWIPPVPARARSRAGYLREMRAAGFEVEAFVPMALNQQCTYSASIYVRKP